MSSDVQIVSCPLCDVPHRAAVKICDHCGHELDQPIDVEQLKDDLMACKNNVVVAVVVLVLMIGLNLLVFGGAGFLILTAPVGWGVWNWTRLRTIDRRLARVSAN